MPARLPFNPIVVDDVMYVAGAKGVVVALDAATGKPMWTSTEQAPERGLTYWESADRSDRRLLLKTGGGLRAIDATTGTLIKSFGQDGFVDMRTGEPRRLGGPNKTPGRIFENLIVVGSNTGEGYGSPPGDLRAYDVVTGRLVWTFHTIPRPGEFGYDTWPPDAWKYAGGANTWGEITIDTQERDRVRSRPGSPTHDLYGADRVGDNLFGNCLLALDARTGKRLWHFQTVHHDLWDYDLAAAPKLLTVATSNGKPVDIVAQAGKTGFLYVFERLTGKPLWPIEERPVPKSEVPGEVSSPTQPFPTKPPPFARQVFTPDDVNPFMSAEEQETLRQAVRDAANHKGCSRPRATCAITSSFPARGAARTGEAWRPIPATGMLFVRSLEMPSYRRMALSAERQGPPPIKGGQREQEGYATYSQMLRRVSRPGSGCRCGRRRSSARMASASLIRQGKEQMPPFPEAVLSAERVDGTRSLSAQPAARRCSRGRVQRRAHAAPAAESEPLLGPGDAIRGIVLRGLVHEQRTSRRRAAVDAARRLRPERRHDQVARRRRPGAGTRGPGTFRTTGTVRPRNGPVVTAGGLVFAAELAGSHAARVRQRHRQGALGARARGEPGGHSRRLPDPRPAVHRVRGRRVVGHGNRSGVEERVSPQAGADRGAGLLRVRAAAAR